MSTEPRPTILVVNNDPIQLSTTSGLLEREGMRVVRCVDAAEALAALSRAHTVDAIVTDLDTPGIDDRRLCRLLRSSDYAAFNHLPILATAATLSGTGTEPSAGDPDVNAILPVPYTAADLHRGMRRLLPGRVPPSGTQVLLVAEPSAALNNLKTAFEASADTVHVATSGEEGLQLLRKDSPDIVILDDDCLGRGDHRLFRAVKAQGASPVVLILTSDPNPARAVECVREGADGYVRKPYAPEYVLRLCEQARREQAFSQLEAVLEQRTVSVRDSESRFRSLSEGILDIVLISDHRGTIQYINAVGARRLHWSPDQLIGKPLSLLLTPEGLTVAPGHSEGARSRTETSYRTRTGHRIAVEESMCPIVFNRNSAILRVARDITERQRAEDEMARLEQHLQESEKMHAIGTLAGGVAHDFNNLLTVILGHAHLMKMRTTPGDDHRQDLTNIETAVQRAKALTEQLLALAGRGKERNTVVDIRGTIREVIALLSRTFDKKIVLQEESTAEAAYVMGDPSQIHQVILNLSVNARDAMPNGGLITYRTEVVQADDGLRRRLSGMATGRYVTVSVCDTGDGIPADIQERIFEPFFTTKDSRSGTGMGLAMVQRIVQKHGGAIHVESTVGRGTTFSLHLPLAEPGEQRVQPKTEDPTVAGTGTVLLADDEELVRNVTAGLLRHLGYEVVTARDGQEALQCYQEHGKDIALVVLDLIMPRMNGRECFRALRAINPNVKAVMITGCDKDGSAEEILAEGIQDLVQKPFALTHLSAAIARAMGTHAKAGRST